VQFDDDCLPLGVLNMPAWVYRLGREFAKVLSDPNFDLLADWPHWNRRGQQGHSYYATCHSRRFCMSQSKRQGPDEMANLAHIFADGNAIDTRVGPFYCNRKGQQLGLIVAAWNGSQWVQMISPGTTDQPRQDAFVALVARIRADRAFDPHPLDIFTIGRVTHRRLQELQDILKIVQARRDFDW
jgi:hypothetical protein